MLKCVYEYVNVSLVRSPLRFKCLCLEIRQGCSLPVNGCAQHAINHKQIKNAEKVCTIQQLPTVII